MFKPIGNRTVDVIEVAQYIIHKDEMWRVDQRERVTDGYLLILSHWGWPLDHTNRRQWVHAKNTDMFHTLNKIDE